MSPSDSPPSSTRVLARCDELANITDEPGGITRGFLSPAMARANRRAEVWMRQAGLETQQDAAGNLIGLRRSPVPDAPVLVLGSHLDTVRNAGRYDGVLGVLLAIDAVASLGGEALPFDVEVLAFSDEEGLRYGVPFLGSQAMIGELDPLWLERLDDQGISIQQAIEAWDGNPASLTCRFRGRPCLGYLEAHIEQGPQLELAGQSLGVLDSLCCASWLRCRFVGQADHAGTTPMDLRRDALPAAAELVLETERLGLQTDDLVATVGCLEPSPGAGNVIPGQVELSLDLRHPQRAVLDEAIHDLLRSGETVALRRGLTFEHEVLLHQDGITADSCLSETLAEAAVACGHPAPRLVVGAGHDAMILARRMPVTMLFLRTPGGLSHHPDESVLAPDVDAALQTLVHFLHLTAQRARGEAVLEEVQG